MEQLSGGQLSDVRKEELIDQFQQQVALANVQELLNKIVDKCFRKCITKPGTSLDGSDQKCLAMCMDRFMETFDLVSRTYTQRIQRESQRLQSA